MVLPLLDTDKQYCDNSLVVAALFGRLLLFVIFNTRKKQNVVLWFTLKGFCYPIEFVIPSIHHNVITNNENKI